MDKEYLIKEWRKRDPEFEDLDGFTKFIEERAAINTMEFVKPYRVLRTLKHLTYVGGLSMHLYSDGIAVKVNGHFTAPFVVPIPIIYIPAYDCNVDTWLSEAQTTKLLTMLFETMKHSQCITVETTCKSINIYAEYGDGDRVIDFSYVIDLPVDEGDKDES